MATFNGVTFEERGSGNGAFFPVHGQRAKVAVLKIPDSARVYVQILGYDASPLDIPAKLTGAQLSAMRAVIGTHDSIADYAGGGVGATLDDITDVVEVKKSINVYLCTLKFSAY